MKSVHRIVRKSNGEILLSLGDTFKIDEEIPIYQLQQKALIDGVLKKKTKVCVGALIGHDGQYIVGLGTFVNASHIQDFTNYFTYDFNYFPPKGFMGDTSLSINYFLPIHKLLQYRHHTKMKPWTHRPGLRVG